MKEKNHLPSLVCIKKVKNMSARNRPSKALGSRDSLITTGVFPVTTNDGFIPCLRAESP
jgi:hypothetical protein